MLVVWLLTTCGAAIGIFVNGSTFVVVLSGCTITLPVVFWMTFSVRCLSLSMSFLLMARDILLHDGIWALLVVEFTYPVSLLWRNLSRKSLLTSALIAVVETLRMNPDRYAVIYNSKYDDNDSVFDSRSTTSTAISSSHSHSSTKVHQSYYYNEYHEGIIEIANSLLKILLKQMVDKTMVAAVKEK